MNIHSTLYLEVQLQYYCLLKLLPIAEPVSRILRTLFQFSFWWNWESLLKCISQTQNFCQNHSFPLSCSNDNTVKYRHICSMFLANELLADIKRLIWILRICWLFSLLPETVKGSLDLMHQFIPPTSPQSENRLARPERSP